MAQKTFLLPAYLLLLMLLNACTDTDLPELPENGVSWQLAENRKARISDILYQLDISVPRKRAQRLSGVSTIYFTLKQNDLPVVLDFKVPADYLQGVSIGKDPIDFTFENGHIILPAKHFSTGENQVTLEYALGDQSLNRQDDFLYTLLVPDRASTAVPCFDQPNLKARYRLTLRIPSDWKALANGALETEQRQDSVKVLTYAETELLPSYLFDFVVGNFQSITSEIGGRTMTMLHRETDTAKVQRNAPLIFDLHLAALNWLENYTGIKMPFQKFDFALIPSFQYGGMEHPGAITYKASSLFLDENATPNQELGRASLIAHETAHMWFGDLVTMNWFDDVWMKEVFANFMAAKIVNPSFPEIDHDLRFLLAHYPSAYAVDRSAGTHPIQQKLDNLKDAGTLYGAIIYQKAPIVMRMLEREIGEEAMRNGLREYLQTYSYDNATWDDLIAILDQQSPEDLESWNRQWIKQAGMPEISVRPEISEGKMYGITVNSGKTGSDREWGQQLELKCLHENGGYSLPVAMDQPSVSLVFDTLYPAPQLIIPNGDGYGYGYFELLKTDSVYLLQYINRLQEPMLRGVSWLNLWENLVHHRLEAMDLLPALLGGIRTETDPLIRQSILGYLNTLYWKFLPEAERKQVTEIVENALWYQLESTDDRREKTALFNTYRSVAESSVGRDRLYRIWLGDLKVEGLSLSESDYIDLAFQLAVRDFPRSEDILDQQLGRVSNIDRQARIRFIRPALSNDIAVRDSFFNSLKLEENRQVESWVQDALGWLHHPLRAAASEKYITPTLEMLEEIQATGDIFFPKRVLDNTFNGHRSEAAVSAVRQFLRERPNYPANLRNKILQAADLTFRAVEQHEQPEQVIMD
ncbi:MAG: M1 family aminopeptidase [Saprospiraceae bacterium]